MLFALFSLASASVTCHCETPGQGTAHHNKLKCTNNAQVWCMHNQECFSHETRPWDRRGELCRIPRCSCATPRKGTAHHNMIVCTDKDFTYCAHDEECFRPREESRRKDLVAQLCRKPGTPSSESSSSSEEVAPTPAPDLCPTHGSCGDCMVHETCIFNWSEGKCMLGESAE